MEYSSRSYAKWILAGEHSILRGGSALVFPFTTYYLQFDYESKDTDLELVLSSGVSATEMFFWGVTEKALQMVGKSRADLRGVLKIQSKIPIGGGLGSSAALCVGLLKWFHHLGWIHEEEIFCKARELENIFHGKSSGVDVVGAMSERGQLFYSDGRRESIDINWSPVLSLSDCGQKGITADCIKKVNSLFDSNRALAEKIDKNMNDAVSGALDSLRVSDAEEGVQNLARSIDLAGSCFRQWELVSKQLESHMQLLLNAGALAVKPTGSGLGGYVLALWPKKPTSDQIIEGCFWL